jgi:isoquinoline 1-oxidoreductase alpha subunit
MVTLNVNGKDEERRREADTPLLWVLREHLALTGTKYGCGMAQCGACTVHLDGQAGAQLLYPGLGDAAGKKITTIEGLWKPTSQAARRAGRPGRRSTCRSAATASRARS